MVLLWTIGLIALAIVSAIVISKIKTRLKKKRNKAWQNGEMNAWLENYSQAKSDYELSRLSYPDTRWVSDQVDEAVEAIKLAETRMRAASRAQVAKEAAEFYDMLRSVSDLRERWKLLTTEAPRATLGVRDGEKSISTYEEECLKPLVVELLESARTGDAESFSLLESLTTANSGGDSPYKTYTWEEYETPTDWDELTVRFHKNPMVYQFRNQPTYEAGEILLLATEALRKHSFIEAKLVLAYGMVTSRASYSDPVVNWPWRDAAGDILRTKLAAMIDAEHVKRGLFQEQPATSVEQ